MLLLCYKYLGDNLIFKYCNSIFSSDDNLFPNCCKDNSFFINKCIRLGESLNGPSVCPKCGFNNDEKIIKTRENLVNAAV